MAGGDRNPVVGPSPVWGWAGAFGCCFLHPQDPLAWGGRVLILRQGWRLPPLSPCALSPSGHTSAAGTGHIWPGRCGVSARGSPAVACFHLPLIPNLPTVGHSSARLHVGWEGGDTWESCPIPLWGWGGCSAQGGPGSPPASGSLARHGDLLLLLAVLSCEGGRTIWSPLRQPNKPGNAGQALQIPLTAVGCGAEPATRA